ncbi:MAG: hypothetical protein WA924_16985 [Burkholderiaceae bacterium]
MREVLAGFGVLQWLLVLLPLIWLLGTLIGRGSRPKPRTSIQWPDRPAIRRNRRPVLGQPSELELEPPSAQSIENMRKLLSATLHDRPAIERMIAHEMRRSPGISRDEAISRAYQRWVDDNR